MTVLHAEDHQEERIVLDGWPVLVTTYRVGERYYCHVANTDPGATIARAAGSDAEEAKRNALAVAGRRLTGGSPA